ncbi:MAG: hypothetical protein IPM14_00920 [bacterium]|nr:hypothetical protein [bacterium]
MDKIYLVAILLLCFFISCEDDVITPTEKIYGVRGSIIDSSGEKINGVNVYCLFNYSYIPSEPNVKLLPLGTQDSIFTNQLYQNFPNPVFHETFIRFSLDAKSVISLELNSINDNKTYYSYKDTLNYGLYQHYLGNLDQDPQLENGIYSYKLKSSSLDGIKFEDKKELLLIGTENKPNSISDKNGNYLFNINEAFVGDTIMVCNFSDPNNVYEKVIYDYIFLLFRKAGYLDRIVGFTMYPGILYTQDVILYPEEDQ